MRYLQLPIILALVAGLVAGPIEAQAQDCPACSTYASETVGGHGDSSKPTNQLSMQSIINHCGPVPGQQEKSPGAGTGSLYQGQSGQSSASAGQGVTTLNQGVDVNFTSSDEGWNQCFHEWIAAWGQLGQYCEVQSEVGTAYDYSEAAAIAYTAAAALCLTSCILNAAGVTAAAAVTFDVLCAVGDFTALGIDIAASNKLTDANNTASAMPSPNPAASDTSSDNNGNAQTGSDFLYSAMGTQFVALLAMENPAAAKVLSCIGAGLLTAGAVFKWMALSPLSSAGTDNCTAATNLIGSVVPSEAPSTGPSTGPSTAPVGINSPGSGGAPGQGGGSNKNGGKGAPISPFVQNFTKHPFDPQFAAATAGPFFPLIKGFTQDNLDKGLQKLGANAVQDIAKNIANGMSPAQAAAQAAGAPPELSSALNQMEKMVEQGKFKIPAQPLPAGLMTRGGGSGPATGDKKANPFGMLGMRGPSATGTVTETAFDKAKRDLATSEASGDIWHEGFGGTIFQIVSSKLEKTHDRIDQLEWDSPLNRALMGLPARKNK